MKKLLAFISTLSIVLPGVALAAYNDVTLGADTVSISANGVTVNVTGSGATIESIAVGSTSFDISIQPNSSITITAPNKNLLVISTPQTIPMTKTCDSSTSSATISGGTSGVTVTVTPSSDTLCSTASTTAGGGSSGGGGGGNGAPVGTTSGGGSSGTVMTAPAVPAPASQSADIVSLLAQIKSLVATIKSLGGTVSPQLEATLAQFGGGTNASFSRDLQLGSTGDDVKALQMYLNTHGFSVASSGPGSPGNETMKFGAATKAALIKLQKAAGISPAAGYFGSKTRAYITANP